MSEPAHPAMPSDEEVILVDLMNRVLDRGIVVQGDVLISVAGVDLIQLGLNLVLASTETSRRRLEGPNAPRTLPERGDAPREGADVPPEGSGAPLEGDR